MALPPHHGQNVSSISAGRGAVRPQDTTTNPISLSAYPISLSAYPIAQGTVPLNSTPTQACTGGVQAAGCTVVKLSPSKPITAETPVNSLAGYLPVHLQGAYGVTPQAQTAGFGMTVAIVTTETAPATINGDLSVYRNTMSLPPCTLASGCLKVVSVSSSPPPAVNSWSEETAIDTEMVSAICPNCSILVVLANSPSIADLAKAVALAATYHPVAISNSYAVREAADNAAYAPYYDQPGIAVVAGAGDTGYGVNFPASAPTVVAVGGTTLSQNPQGHFNPQTLWSHTGSGCSGFFAKPAWQTDSGCPMRTANDIAALADPAHGVAGYSSAGGGWNVYGGTSVAAPIVAALYALAGVGPHSVSDLYSAGGFGPVSSTGNNGTCSAAYLCSVLAGSRYNAPVGLGVPNGIGPFQSKAPPPPPPAPNATAAPGASPSLAIQQTSNGPWTYGQNGAQYAITVVNDGSGATRSPVTVVEKLPAGFTWNGGGLGHGIGCTAGGAQLACTISAAIAANSSTSFTLPVSVASSGLGSSVTATAAAYGGGDPLHAAAGSAVTSAAVTSIGLPSLAIALASNTAQGPWTYGQPNAQYTITVTNVGYGATSGPLTIGAVLPAGVTLRTGPGGQINGGGGSTCTAQGSQQMTCTMSQPVNAGSSVSVNVPVAVATSRLPASVTATASVYGGGDPVYASQASANVISLATPIALPALAISETDNGPWIYGQNNAQYTIVVSNLAAGQTAGPITVGDEFPAGFTWNGQPPPQFACTATGHVVICTTAQVIPAHGNVRLSFAGTLASGGIGNALTSIAGTWGGGDPVHTGEWTAARATDITRLSLPALSISQSAQPNAWWIGENGTQYRLSVTNAGAGPTSGAVVVTDMLPAGVSASGGNFGPVACSVAGGQLTCTMSQPINPGQTQQITLPVTLGAATPSASTNVATVYGGGDLNHLTAAAAATSSLTLSVSPAPQH